MKERPILFSGEMVRAILDGRKTQTRRVVKPQPDHMQVHHWKGQEIRDCESRAWCWKEHDFGEGDPILATPGREMAALCPYGQPGDRLWVRETWRVASSGRHYPTQTTDIYAEWREQETQRGGPRGGQHQSRWLLSDADSDTLTAKAYGARSSHSWVSPLFMPRWASRITLEITDVRVERLQAIDEHDAFQEGVAGWVHDERCETARDGFRVLWDRINGKRAPWSSNPWVWVVSFKRVEQARAAA